MSRGTLAGAIGPRPNEASRTPPTARTGDWTVIISMSFIYAAVTLFLFRLQIDAMVRGRADRQATSADDVAGPERDA
jgi:hypothetical protein